MMIHLVKEFLFYFLFRNGFSKKTFRTDSIEDSID